MYYAATVLFGRTDKQFWKMTPAQISILSDIHIRINNPDSHKTNGISNNTNRARKISRLDPDDARTPVILAGLASMKLPRKR